MNTKSQEHLVAVVEPTDDGEQTLDLARDVVVRGGRATVVIVLSPKVRKHFRDFANAEELSYPEAREIALERLTNSYADRLGVAPQSVVTSEMASGRRLFDAARRAEATEIAVPARLAKRRGWRASARRSSVPVVIAPPRAA